MKESLETTRLKKQLEYSLLEDTKFKNFMENNPIGSKIIFEDYDGWFELSHFEGTVELYDIDSRTIYVNEHKATPNYKHTIPFSKVISK